MALESKLEARDKEVQQLTRALEKTDEHISSLESELRLCRCAHHSIPKLDSGSSHMAGTANSSVQLTIGQIPDIVENRSSAHSADDSDLAGARLTTDDASAESCRKKLKFAADSCI